MSEAEEIESTVQDVDTDIDKISQDIKNFEKSGDPDFVRYVVSFYHDRERLLAEKRPRTEQISIANVEENKAEQEFYALLKTGRFTLTEIAEKLQLSFSKFMKVYNIHVAYVYDYPALHTLYDFITKRRMMFKEFERAIRAPSYARFMDPKHIEVISSRLAELQQLYMNLDKELKPLDKLFADFGTSLKNLYENMTQLDCFRPFRKEYRPGFFARLIGRKPKVEFDREGAVEYFKKNKPLLSKDDKSRFVALRGTTENMRKTIIYIRGRKESLRKMIVEIDRKETVVRKVLEKADLHVQESQKEFKAAA